MLTTPSMAERPRRDRSGQQVGQQVLQQVVDCRVTLWRSGEQIVFGLHVGPGDQLVPAVLDQGLHWPPPRRASSPCGTAPLGWLGSVTGFSSHSGSEAQSRPQARICANGPTRMSTSRRVHPIHGSNLRQRSLRVEARKQSPYIYLPNLGAALLRRRPNQSLRQRGRRQLDPSRRGEGAAEGTGGRRYLCRQRRLGVFRWYSRAWWRVSVRINAPAARGGLRTVATAAKCHRAPVDSHPVAGRMPTGLQGAGDEHRTPHRRCHVDNVEYHCGFQGVRGGAREAVAMVTRRRISTKERSGSRFSAASSGCRPS